MAVIAFSPVSSSAACVPFYLTVGEIRLLKNYLGSHRHVLDEHPGLAECEAWVKENMAGSNDRRVELLLDYPSWELLIAACACGIRDTGNPWRLVFEQLHQRLRDAELGLRVAVAGVEEAWS